MSLNCCVCNKQISASNKDEFLTAWTVDTGHIVRFGPICAQGECGDTFVREAGAAEMCFIPLATRKHLKRVASTYWPVSKKLYAAMMRHGEAVENL
jgi:hypothetical protein